MLKCTFQHASDCVEGRHHMWLGAEKMSFHQTTSVDRWDYLARTATLLSNGLIYDVATVDGQSVEFLPSQRRSKDVYFQHIWMLLG